MSTTLDLASQPLLQAETFNDDDYYVIDATTNRLILIVGSKSAEPTPAPGHIVIRGMLAKHLPIWRQETDYAMLRALGSSI